MALYSYGPCSHGLCIYCLYSSGLDSYGLVPNKGLHTEAPHSQRSIRHSSLQVFFTMHTPTSAQSATNSLPPMWPSEEVTRGNCLPNPPTKTNSRISHPCAGTHAPQARRLRALADIYQSCCQVIMRMRTRACMRGVRGRTSDRQSDELRCCGVKTNAPLTCHNLPGPYVSGP